MYTLRHDLQWIIRVYHPQTQFCSCDLDLDPMTLIYEPDLKLCAYRKMTFPGQGFRKLKR